MSGQSPNRRQERKIAEDRLEPQAPRREDMTCDSGAGAGRPGATSGSGRDRTGPSASPADQELTGVVGDASTTGSRSGDDARRRGWFWHWNNIVTQYAPMIGLKGVGLVNSYTVWTDRRESSPHRGYAFPSQQSEADFYGEDRAELMTINKILVVLDLIEIRKEMVLRVDEKGRRWKVPHNFYRVKDHSDGFTLTAGDVLKVAELADRDRAVYRYLRRMFSPRFSPIDSQNVWHGILEEVRRTGTWQRLASRTAKDESKASARSKAGHVARRSNEASDLISLPQSGDNRERVSTATDIANDSAAGVMEAGERRLETTVAPANNGSGASVEWSNSGFDENREPVVALANKAVGTNVHPTNSMYYESLTTTTTGERGVFANTDGLDPGQGPGQVPDDSRLEAHATTRFEEANDRVSTPAERRLLRQLADQFDSVAAGSGHRGWMWLAFAIDDAVAAGSTFVAPRRVREILVRWGRDGCPEEYASHVPESATTSHPGPKTVTREPLPSHRTVPPAGRGESVPESSFVTPVFMVEACGMSNRQIWSAVLSDLQRSGVVGQAEVSTWLRDAAVVGISDQGGLVVGVPHEVAHRRTSGRYLAAIRQSVQRVTGLSLAIDVVLFRDWPAA